MSWTGDIVVEGSHENGYTIPAWVDGHTQARVVYRGWDAGPELRQGESEVYEKVIASERELLVTLGSVESYQNLELVSAELESDVLTKPTLADRPELLWDK